MGMGVLFLVGCRGELASKDTPSPRDMNTPDQTTDQAGDIPADAGDQTGDMPANDCGLTPLFKGLEPTCATCHRAGNTPYFANTTSFYNLILNNPKWVVPGQPDNSTLIALLEGRAPGAYPQMPLGSASFTQLEANGQTSIGLAQIKTIITDLDGCKRQDDPKTPVTPVERKSAQQIVNTLYQHLGLTSEDIVRFTQSRNYNDTRFHIYSPDHVKPVTNDPHIRPASQGPGIRWFSIGGGSTLYGTRPNRTFSPTFGQTFTQVSQAWCGFAVDKDNNDALFKHVSQQDLDSATDAQIKDNLKYLMLRFWGHVATEQEVDTLKSNVYDFYKQEQNTRTAWVAVCASLVRDPMWLSY